MILSDMECPTHQFELITISTHGNNLCQYQDNLKRLDPKQNPRDYITIPYGPHPSAVGIPTETGQKQERPGIRQVMAKVCSISTSKARNAVSLTSKTGLRLELIMKVGLWAVTESKKSVFSQNLSEESCVWSAVLHRCIPSSRWTQAWHQSNPGYCGHKLIGWSRDNNSINGRRGADSGSLTEFSKYSHWKYAVNCIFQMRIIGITATLWLGSFPWYTYGDGSGEMLHQDWSLEAFHTLPVHVSESARAHFPPVQDQKWLQINPLVSECREK